MGNKQQSSNESSAQMFQALKDYAPDAMRALTEAAGPIAIDQAKSDAAVAPIYNQSQLDMLRQYGPQLSEVGTSLDRQNQLGASETELAIAQGPGRELNREALDLQRVQDPEYYDSRERVSQGYEDLLGGMDPNALSGSEVANVERSNARTMGGYNPSATATTANAMTFGKELDNKRSRFQGALQGLTSALEPLKSGISGFQTATRREVVPNAGINKFQDTAKGSTDSSMDFFNNSLNQVGANQRQRDAQRKSLMDQVGQGIGMAGQFAGGVAGAF